MATASAAISSLRFSGGPPRRPHRWRCGPVRCSVTGKPAVAMGSDASPSSPGGGGPGEPVGTLRADCVVVGAGISGLCIAQALATRHAGGGAGSATEVLVTEARDRVGGNITTVERDGYLWEEGPNSFQPSDPVLTMAVDSGLKDDLVLGDPNAPRFVLWEGKLRPVPSKPTDLPFFDLMSIGGKLRAGFGAIGIRPPPPGHEESVEDFVRRNLGDEVFERLIEPFCSGVYAGDPAKLSMKAAFGRVWRLEQNGGSIIGGTFKAIQERSKSGKPPRDPRLPKPKGQTVGSFRKGLAMLPNAISSRYFCCVLSLSWFLWTIYSSSLFPGRAPPGRVLLLNYIGGATNTGIVSKSESDLVESVDRDLRKMLINTDAVEPIVHGVRVWPQAIPQFLIGHLDHLETAKNALQKGGFEGLFLGGNYVAGVALGRCVEGAYESASEVANFLAKYAYT
ncbi:hypothetical protein Taro_004175 [Colocasia esculenta]|uniref:Protoporphyrinogen oxidase n=1 Tax=Colocasia esculenta TaxID=4460 RepID=A0A843TQV3_COLES|nr:hypothetical protein [Colocasia esculenta]